MKDNDDIEQLAIQHMRRQLRHEKWSERAEDAAVFLGIFAAGALCASVFWWLVG